MVQKKIAIFSALVIIVIIVSITYIFMNVDRSPKSDLQLVEDQVIGGEVHLNIAPKYERSGNCQNGLDDDKDGFIDCEDTDCADWETCI